MTVFYSIYNDDGTRDFCFTKYLGNIIFTDLDLSYWIVPGTFNLED